MVKQVKVSNFTEVKGIVSAAAKCYNCLLYTSYKPDGLSAAGGRCGRAGLLPHTGPPPLHPHFKGLRGLCLCAGAEQRVLRP